MPAIRAVGICGVFKTRTLARAYVAQLLSPDRPGDCLSGPACRRRKAANPERSFFITPHISFKGAILVNN